MYRAGHIILIILMGTASVLCGQASGPRQQLQEAERRLDAAQYAVADSLLRAIDADLLPGAEPELYLQSLHLRGYLALERGNYDRAYEQFVRAYARARSQLPAGHPARGQAGNDLGHFHFLTGRLDSARIYHREALDIRLKHYGDRHPKVADSYNNLGNILQTSGRPADALEWYERALAIRRVHASGAPADLAAVLNNIGNANLSLGRMKPALDIFRRVRAMRRVLFGPDHPQYGRSLQNLGNAHYLLGAIDSARFYYGRALDNARLHYDSLHPQLADLYENLGNCALQQGMLEEADRRHRQSLRIRETYRTTDPLAPAGSFLHLGDVSRQRGDYLEALRLSERGHAILIKHLPPEDPFLADAWEKLGLCHQMLGHFAEARQALTRTLEIRWNFYGPDHPLVAGAFTNLGNIYWQDADPGTAIYYYREALGIWEQYRADFKRERAETYSNLGNSYLKERSWEEALAAYRRALQLSAGVPDRLPAGIWQQMGVSLDGLGRYREALSAYDQARALLDSTRSDQQSVRLFTLGARANTLLHSYEASRQTDTLRLAQAAFDETLELLGRRQDGLRHTESRQRILAFHYDLFAGAVACRLALWDLERDSSHLWEAFRLSEVSKGIRFREKWADQAAFDKPGGRDMSALARALSVDPVSAESLQRQLTGRRGLLAFLAGPERFFWFFLKDGRLQAGSIGGVREIDQLVAGLGQCITQYPRAGSEQQVALDSAYQLYAGELYRQLWRPLEAHFRGASSLVIVPDGSLAYLPFAVLLTATPPQPLRYRSYPYLLHDYQLSYAYSTALLARAQLSVPTSGKKQCLAVAPVFDTHRPPLAPLAYNVTEVEDIAAETGAVVLRDRAASLGNFLEMAPQFRVLHLATHGVANIYRSEYAFLAFTRTEADTLGRLYVEDLYQMELPADMIVMSACESGVGRYQAGEGAVSLGRGFALAGARSVIATLWSVNDAKTADFMVGFYRRLRAGDAKDEAIREVQLRYQEQASQADAHPFYWAAYQPIGNMESLSPATSSGKWWYALILPALGGLLLWRVRPGLFKNLSK